MSHILRWLISVYGYLSIYDEFIRFRWDIMTIHHQLIEEYRREQTNVAASIVRFIFGNIKKYLGLGDLMHTRDTVMWQPVLRCRCLCTFTCPNYSILNVYIWLTIDWHLKWFQHSRWTAIHKENIQIDCSIVQQFHRAKRCMLFDSIWI